MATRQAIRAAIKALVESDFASAFDYRPAQIFEEELPSVTIYFEDGDTERDFDDEGHTVGRLIIEVVARASGNLDAELDAKSSLAEKNITNSDQLSGLVEHISRSGFTYERDPESNSGSLSQTFTVHYLDED